MGIHLAGFSGIGIQPYPLFRLCYSCHICVYPLSPAVEHLALCVAVVGICSRLGADFFSETPGLGAASMTLTALCAPPLLRLFTPKDCLEDMVPGYRTLGGWNYIWYVTLLVLLQQASVMMLEIFSFFSALDMLYTYLGSSALSIVLILVLERMRGNK